jgi:hypothetical protein
MVHNELLLFAQMATCSKEKYVTFSTCTFRSALKMKVSVQIIQIVIHFGGKRTIPISMHYFWLSLTTMQSFEHVCHIKVIDMCYISSAQQHA